ncbi:MAG TPA: outer membrane protein transport protein [Bacteroidales bacterium]|nr:outer membrane protein transport protein [Bacteroidales bacterium]
MKKQILLITSFVFIASVAFGGGIVTNSNQSAYWVRTLVRDAAIGPDAVYFNPAGLTKMEDGFHFSLNSQSIFQSKDVTSSYPFLSPSPKKYLGDVKAPVFPGVYATWKKSKIAVSFGFNPIGGGGGAEYKKGLPSFESSISGLVPMLQSSLQPLDAGLTTGYTFNPNFSNITGYSADIYFKGSSIYFGYQLGLTYQINDMISAYLGGRLVTAKNKYKGHIRDIAIDVAPAAAGYGTLYNVQPGSYTPGNYLRGVASAVGVPAMNAAILNGTAAVLDGATADMEVDAEESGTGFAPILGVNLALSEKLNIGLKYEFKTKLDLKQNVKDNLGGGIFVNDSTVHSDMPAMFSLGVAYKITPKFSATAGFHYYFDKAANYGKTLDLNGEAVKNDKVIDKNYYELGLGLEYGITDNIFFSAGYLYAKPGVSADYQSDMSYALPSSTVGGGFGIKFSESIMANLGVSYSIYKEETKTLIDGTTTEKYFKNTLILGIGLDFAF